MKLALAVLGVSLSLAGCATAPKDDDTAAHHPPGSATAAPAAPSSGQMDSMMRSMQEMHDRMMAARTPEERAKLMQEHMRLMHEGMGMMGRMRGGWGPRGGMGGMGGMGMGGGMAMSPEMMGRRMDMMEMMMQMMMDREAATPPASR